MKFGYVTVVGLSILHLIQALNTTDELDNSTLSSIYVQDRVTTWLDGLKDCERDENGSNEAYKFLENRTYIADLVDTHGPLWTNGMEVVADRNGTKEVFRIYQKNPDLKARCVCWSSLDPMTSLEPDLMSFSEANSVCYTKNYSLPTIHPTNVTTYNKVYMINTPFWIHSKQEHLYINASNIEVRCYIYDVDGILKTENCTSKYKTLCVKENAFHVLEFVNNVTLPRLQTKSTTVFMDPQIQYTVIGVGAAIVIAIVVAILICCCKRKKIESSEERKSTQLADNYSETVDSMAMKEQVVYETPNNSEYATPDDAICKARQRQSIGENEYDVINSDPKKKKPTGGAVHAYNHVTLVSPKDKQNNSDLDENQYDVTNYGRQATVLIAPNDKTENEYMSINVEK